MTGEGSQRERGVLVLFGTVVFAVVLLRTAWVSDDAYITLRTVDNLVNGYGLTWNPAERAQAYTHPLWLLLITPAYAVTRESYLTTTVLSILFSLLAFALVGGRIAREWWGSLIGMTILLLSKSFIDYSTSGLENPATHLILALFLIIYLGTASTHSRCRLSLCALLVALAGLNRLDALLLLTPALIFEVARSPAIRKRVPILVVGFLPLIAWELFSTFYYGSPLPNTAYAKLNTGVPTKDLVEQGSLYYLDALERDPLTMAVIAAGIAIALAKGSARHRCLATGILLYLIYILMIGGDFMSGRFFSAPLLVATVLLMEALLTETPSTKSIILGLTIIMGFASATPTFTRDSTCARTGPRFNGIEDERCFYYEGAGLLRLVRNVPRPPHEWAELGRALRQEGAGVEIGSAIGYLGFFAGPRVHIVDMMGLADPLLARLPTSDLENWRIGHFRRDIPDGYIESIRTEENRIADADLALFYDRIHLITAGDLLDPERLRAIWELNTGQYAQWIRSYLERAAHVSPDSSDR